MTELEKIAEDLGQKVKYEQNNGACLESVYYGDQWSLIMGITYLAGNNLVIYHLDVTKLDAYLVEIKKLESNLGRRIESDFRNRTRTIPAEAAQAFACNSFDVEDFKDLPELIRLHIRLAD